MLVPGGPVHQLRTLENAEVRAEKGVLCKANRAESAPFAEKHA